MDFRRDLFVLARLGRCGDYLEANGVRFYYETHGEGPPLFFFHGGLSTLHTFRHQIPFFARHFRVILPERRGHGRTADSAGDFSYEAMADDMAAFMKAFGTARAPVIGYSDGANLILPLALKYPGLLERFISVGGNFHYEGCEAWHREELRQIPEGGGGDVDRYYEKYSPDGREHSAEVFEKARRLWLEEPRFSAADLKPITAPALILAGDHDVIRPEHSVEFYRALPAARLAIVPGTSHGVLKERPEWVNAMMLDFLRTPIEELLPPPQDEEKK